MSFVTEIQQDIVAQTQELEGYLHRFDELLNQFAGLPSILAFVVNPIVSTVKSVQKIGWDVHGVAMDLTGGGFPTQSGGGSPSPFEDTGDDLKNLKAWWSYVQETIASPLSGDVVTDNQDLKITQDQKAWQDESGARELYLESVRNQAERFSTVSADAGEFMSKLIDLEEFIDAYWWKFWEALGTFVGGAAVVVAAVAEGLGAIAAAPVTVGISGLALFGIMAQITAGFTAILVGGLMLGEWSALHAPDPPQLSCGQWPRPPA